jgi:hypothetical protein
VPLGIKVPNLQDALLHVKLFDKLKLEQLLQQIGFSQDDN